MEIKGKVHEIGEIQAISDKFKKREIILEYAENPTYPEFIKIEVHNDKCDKLDELRAGDEITAHINLRGRAWTDKANKQSYFNSIQMWKFDIHKTVAAAVNVEDQEDDLPF